MPGVRATVPRVRFRVEATLPAHGIVACRKLDPGTFAFATATLDGHPIKGVEMPRALLPDGTQDPDAFAFTLTKKSDAERFAVGQEVELTGSPASPGSAAQS